MQVIGIENVDYVSKKTSNRVFGKKLYLAEDLPKDKGSGKRCLEAYCKNDIALNVVIGDNICLYYDRYGNVQDVVIE